MIMTKECIKMFINGNLHQRGLNQGVGAGAEL